MHAVFLSFDGLSDPLGQSQVIPYLQGLCAHSRLIRVISLEKAKICRAKVVQDGRWPEQPGLAWTAIPFLTEPPILGSIVNLMRLRQTCLAFHRQVPIDLVHCRSYMAALVGLELKRRFGCKFLFDMRGFWPDERVDGKLWNLSNPLYRLIYKFFKSKERQFYLESDAMVSLTRAGRDDIYRRMADAILPPIEVIPCCVDTVRFEGRNQGARHRIRENLSIAPDADVLVYVGSLGTWYCLDEMLDFFQEYRTVHSEAVFLIVTRDTASMVNGAARRRNVPAAALRVVSATPAEVPSYLSAADLGISFILPAYSKLASSPTKLPEMLAMDLPVVSNAGVGDVDSLYESERIGPLVRGFCSSEYQRAIADLDENMPLYSSSARELAVREFSLSTGQQRYHGLYEMLAQGI